MSGAAPLVVAVACFAAATALALRAGPPAPEHTAAGGVGRTLLVTTLFLRAEALRKEGRIAEVEPLYRRVLALDPDNVLARDFLAATMAEDLRAAAPDAAARVRWWEAARDLVDEGLARRPDEPRLVWRAADLLLGPPAHDRAVAARLAQTVPDADLVALRGLAKAARLTGEIPRIHVAHLEAVARLAPRAAAVRLATGRPGVEEALAIGHEILARRATEYASFRLDDEPPISAEARLRGALALVESVRDAVRFGPTERARARALVDAYGAAVHGDDLADVLGPLLR